MNAIEETISELTRIKNTAEKVMIEETKKESKLMSDLNIDQLMSGVDAVGKNMPDYAGTSKKSGKIRLFDTGKYQEGIHPLFSNSGFDMTTSGP